MDRSADVRAYLLGLVQRASVGERLPTVRGLMREFGLSQVSVQRALAELKARGLIVAEAGRGTFVAGHASQAVEGAQSIATASQRRSVLILRRLAGIRRGRVVLDSLQRRLIELGHQTLEVAYSDADHARHVLQTLPRFDACVVQSSFETMPIQMLAAVRRKAEAIIVDGASLVGTDVDAVGFEWGEPVERAVALLRAQGHRRLGFATTTNPFLANQLGRHRYERLRARADDPELLQPALLLGELPYQGYEAALVAMLRARAGETGQLPLTGLIAWGVESGANLRTLLEQAGIRVPRDLSVVLLGHTDIEEESGGFFTMIGYRASDQCDGLLDALVGRWAQPRSPHGLRLTPMHERAGASVAARAEGWKHGKPQGGAVGAGVEAG
jgi:DNA-binding LacI/PurR family transcriptional regulator